jgi:flagellar biosynthesis protein FlhF
VKLKTYQAWSMPEAIAFVKRDLGDDAVILHTRTFERGGFLGFRKRTVVEITAGRAAEMPAEAKPPVRGAAPAKGAGAARVAALGAYARAGAAATSTVAPNSNSNSNSNSTSAPGTAPASPVTDTTRVDSTPDRDEAVLDMAHERERTRRLAMAMAVKLEKEAAERAAASGNEQAVDRAAGREMARAADPRPLREATNSAGSKSADPKSADPKSADPKSADPKSADPRSRDQEAIARGPQESLFATAQRFVLVPEPRSASTAAQSIATRVEWPATAAPDASQGGDGSDGAPALRSAPRGASAPGILPSRGPAGARGEGIPELDAISSFVGRVLERGGDVAVPSDPTRRPAAVSGLSKGPSGGPSAGRRAVELGEPVESALFARLIGEEVAQELARRLAREIARELAASGEAAADPETGALSSAATALLVHKVAAALPADAESSFEITSGRHGPRRIAFIGPTGVGKTTTLAKVAAQLKLHRGLSVGIVAADTYRIAAVDQLRTYAEILGLPMEVASSPREAAEACARLGDCDAILIDTAGRSQNDCMKLSELRAFLAAAEPDETHLVLSATVGARTLAREAEAFGALGVDRLALTKLDEAAAFGTLVSLVASFGKPLSFLTHGQEVPDHIEEARGGRLAALLVAAGDGARDMRSSMRR